MAKSKLMLHCGAREVSRDDLPLVPIPEPTATWFPVGHSTVMDTVERFLTDAGFVIQRARFGLSRNDARMFGTLDLATTLATGITLAVGIRNSLDKSFPLGFCAGSRVFCCDNLAFQSDLLIAKKHTRNGQTRFEEAIGQAASSLEAFRALEVERIRQFQFSDIDDAHAESLILRSYERVIVSHRQLPGVIRHWRKPEHDEFEPRTVWSLANAFTSAMSPLARSNPQRYCGLTMRLQALLGEAVAFPASVEPPAFLERPQTTRGSSPSMTPISEPERGN